MPLCRCTQQKRQQRKWRILKKRRQQYQPIMKAPEWLRTINAQLQWIAC